MKKPFSSKRFWRILLIFAVLFIAAFLFMKLYKPFGKAPHKALVSRSPEYADGSFQNPVPTSAGSLKDAPTIIKNYWQRDVESQPRETYTFKEIHRENLEDSSVSINWIGHAAVLIHYRGHYLLTDPMLSKRASPFSWMGPSRFFPSPIAISDLPEIEAVLISHDHYDHLDYPTITALAAKVKSFVVPLGVGASLRSWGIPEGKIVELNWWEQTETGTYKITSAPARHFSGRLFSRNNTLWASYSIEIGGKKIYFGGDSGIFPGYQGIGEKCGPFDFSLLPIGAYNPSWHDIHLDPEEATEAWKMLDGGKLIPIHWGTFDLALHSWYEPIEKLEKLSQEENIPLLSPEPGQWLSPERDSTRHGWWKQYSKAYNEDSP